MTNTTRRTWQFGPRFPLGRLLATPGVLGRGVELLPLIKRHVRGDWGDLSEEDRAANEQALVDGSRILSAYVLPQGRVWIITESDRSATTLLLPEEY